ncbi:pyruvate kinase [Marichromatium purpuratum 984]|uniref:Pyruvate kinase n=1 Tax=Marichromatium purpuratum 984 TaxID=765910 RepID=W0E1M3_MARPU|nr:pyruvate kinase [Marichromatium purpuratum]AHF04750.1 pyruvate kinase [Marichromatium purpuratum 984]
MPRRTKIVATLGPATDAPEVMDGLIRAGLDLARLNLSHDSHARHRERVERLRERARAGAAEVAVLFDLQGPKIRIGRFADGSIVLERGAPFAIDAGCPLDAGDATRVGTTYPALAEDVRAGDTLLLDDGAIELWVESVEGGRMACRVVIGGKLSNNKGINRKGGGLSAPALTDKDLADIRFAAELDADYLAVSFVRSAEDVRQARAHFQAAGGRGGVVAKIERAEALDGIDEIINAADAIMVARGDLGVEIGDAELPAVQKHLISRARELNSVVITATQMMQSMIENPIPTRAEVFDVANAVLDGTDAVMLSAESSIGSNPVKVVEALDRICREAEKSATRSGHRLDSVFGRVDEAIAMAAMYTANHLGVKAIAALTETGSTVKWMSRISSGIPIHAMTRFDSTRRKVCLFRGVYPVAFDVASTDIHEVNREVIEELLRRGTVRDGDLVIITKGDRSGVEGQTNIMKIMRVGEHRTASED